MRALFVTGTDTGVGKTYVSQALIKGWRAQGLRVGVMKPCETGLKESGVWGPPQDAEKLLSASGASLTLDEVCPFRFGEPMAPAEVAALEGGDVSFDTIESGFHAIAERHDVTLVEGAGGLLVPYSGSLTAADLIARLKIPLIVVARIGLGTINHTCLTVEAVRARGLELLGVVFTRAEDPALSPPGPDEARNPDAVARLCGIKILANLPFSPEIPTLCLDT